MRASAAAAQRKGTAPGLRALWASRIENLSTFLESSRQFFSFFARVIISTSFLILMDHVKHPHHACSDVRGSKLQRGSVGKNKTKQTKKKKCYVDTGPNGAVRIATLSPVCL